MQEIFEDIFHYLRGVWLKRRFVLVISWLICPLAWVYITFLPNQYASEARVYADTRSILQPLLRGLAIQTDQSQELRLMVKTLLSRSNLEEIARATDADIQAESEQEFEDIIANLKDSIKLKSAGRENLYTISYEGADARYVKDVVQVTLDVFVESALGEKRLDNDQANVFISRQIKDYEDRLSSAEKKLAEFKRENQGFMPGSDRSFYSRLENFTSELENTEILLKEAKSRLMSTKEQMQSEELTLAAMKQNTSTEFDDRIDNMQSRLDDLLFRFTDAHPDVIEAKRQLSELHTLKDKELKEVKNSREWVENSTVYQDLKLKFAENENEVASLEVRQQQYNVKITELQRQLDLVPDVEANLTALTRNYDITKSKYEELLSRKESAVISQSVGESGDNIKFRVIDPPMLARSPSGPPRALYLTIMLIVGLGLGVGCSFLISQISPQITSTKQLYQSIGLPVFGVVSATEISGLEGWEKKKMKLFIAGIGLLLITFVLFVVLNSVPSIHQKLLLEVSYL
ncbi:XrtA system polysaccharide chain length determinant [Aliivibrio kagoshimensis]|uniref:XrtA system polysaccharide chain length determinant n=1 Tax=Aliivibrio kagoshimensis TaxID=2910230 RepID=UPI003D14F0FD